MNFPEAILYEIFGYLLTYEVFLSVAFVCKEWNELIYSKFLKDFG